MPHRLGEILRESRIEKNITLDYIETKSGISSHYLLAMELDQYKIIPEHKIDQFLKQYGEIVGLEFHYLKNKYNQQMSTKMENKNPSVTQIVENKLSHRVEDKVNFSRQAKSFDEEEKNTSTKKNTKANFLVDNSKDEDDEFYFESSRHSRLSHNEKRSKSIFIIVLLTFIALLIFVFMFFAVWKQMNKENKAKDVQTSQVNKTTSKSKTNTSSSSQPKTEITSQGQDNYLEATVKKANESVDVTITLTDAESAWISLTNSDIGEAGTTLTKETPTYTATLDKDVSEALLTLGITKGLSVSIDGEPLDLSPITVTDTSYITLKFQ
ncbi:helix-turn-helix domain-containing protein [Streptococcus parauberis]|nr:helix-turn-helix domain-containing protein [Streptococcus parauberis]